ncbi:MAG: hypothetical protein MJA83_02355, partial [Gammaproteobacteria bacterium]|nr:hypothetical protein [Gammaproteobacteria bacterium]
LVTGVHGVLAATGLGLVIFAVITGTDSNPVLIGLGLLVVAALGGFYLFSFHLREEPHPKAVVVLHAGLAVAGVGALLVTFI